ncbi:hypothetical protein CDAR_383221 [Caerostris darwini]|uniref:Uncharacterized protein n=1 Tax=Caerostris darwini TaxID=1538125 RepID=A0AAV4NVD9_9ARAC|nr:hypothetical protein CDAR_383221 [Caerostris darwini]
MTSSNHELTLETSKLFSGDMRQKREQPSTLRLQRGGGAKTKRGVTDFLCDPPLVLDAPRIFLKPTQSRGQLMEAAIRIHRFRVIFQVIYSQQVWPPPSLQFDCITICYAQANPRDSKLKGPSNTLSGDRIWSRTNICYRESYVQILYEEVHTSTPVPSLLYRISANDRDAPPKVRNDLGFGKGYSFLAGNSRHVTKKVGGLEGD